MVSSGLGLGPPSNPSTGPLFLHLSTMKCVSAVPMSPVAPVAGCLTATVHLAGLPRSSSLSQPRCSLPWPSPQLLPRAG